MSHDPVKKNIKMIILGDSGLCSVLDKRWVLSVPKLCFHVDTARGIYVSAMANFDQDFACRSLLGLPANSIEELIYQNRKFYWTRWRILIKILPVFYVEIIKKSLPCVNIYFVVTKTVCKQYKRKHNCTRSELTALPIHLLIHSLFLMLTVKY